ncbi:MAG: glycosyltransferase family 39 protein, partial [Phycisphaerales bacterium]|nr:glycosyltransferase family 39 protein [Phycisphaerales bacterium]
MTSDRADLPRPWFIGLLALLLAVAAAVGLHTALALRPLETHEVFVAQTVREMIARGDYLVPTFGGELRLKKPPLMYWAVAALAKAVGRPDVPEWVARAPSALASLVLAGACVLIGTRVFDRRTALLAGAMLVFSAGVFEYAGNARPEMLYAACSAAGIAAFIAALRSPARSLWWALGGWGCLGLALLAKGPQLPGLMLLGFSGYVLVARGVREWLRAVRPARGVLVMLLVAAPWVVVVIARVDGAGDVWKNELIGLRFGGGDDSADSTSGLLAWLLEVLKPKYLLYLITTLLPWGVLVPAGVLLVWSRQRPEFRAARDVLAALAGAVLGLSLASHSRDYYLLPALP